jgi:predicted transcriptional regulator
MIKNNIKDFLAGRRLEDIAQELGVSRQAILYYIQGKYKAHSLRRIDFLRILGSPWGRILDEMEVWPND